MSVWLVVERAREGCLRSLFKKAWIASDKSTRIPIETFRLALKLHGVDVESDEVECMVANMIYRVSNFSSVLMFSFLLLVEVREWRLTLCRDI